MKKVKIMLSAILVLAIVGGIFAFKAPKKAQVCFYTNTAPSGPSPICTLDLNKTIGIVGTAAYTATDNSLPLSRCTEQPTKPCVQEFVTITDGQ